MTPQLGPVVLAAQISPDVVDRSFWSQLNMGLGQLGPFLFVALVVVGLALALNWCRRLVDRIAPSPKDKVLDVVPVTADTDIDAKPTRPGVGDQTVFEAPNDQQAPESEPEDFPFDIFEKY